MNMAHKVADGLKQAGAPDAVVNDVRDVVEAEMNALATKQELSGLKTDIKQIVKDAVEASEGRLNTKIEKAINRIILAGIAIAALAVGVVEYLK